MFKFVESKTFFYICAVLSLLSVVLGFKYANGGVSEKGVLILMGMFLIAMMIFYNKNNKELLKTLLSTLITIIFINAAFKSVDIFSNIPKLINQYNLRVLNEPIKRIISFVNLLGIPALVLLIYINHFIVNFNGKISKVFININKAIVTIMIIIVLTEVISQFIVNGIYDNELFTIAPPKLFSAFIFNNIRNVVLVLTVVSAEAFINTQRA